MKRVKAAGDTPHVSISVASAATEYDDFVIRARRKNGRMVSVSVEASPAGRMTKAQTFSFPQKEAAQLRTSFLAPLLTAIG